MDNDPLCQAASCGSQPADQLVLKPALSEAIGLADNAQDIDVSGGPTDESREEHDIISAFLRGSSRGTCGRGMGGGKSDVGRHAINGVSTGAMGSGHVGATCAIGMRGARVAALAALHGGSARVDPCVCNFQNLKSEPQRLQGGRGPVQGAGPRPHRQRHSDDKRRNRRLGGGSAQEQEEASGLAREAATASAAMTALPRSAAPTTEPGREMAREEAEWRRWRLRGPCDPSCIVPPVVVTTARRSPTIAA